MSWEIWRVQHYYAFGGSFVLLPGGRPGGLAEAPVSHAGGLPRLPPLPAANRLMARIASSIRLRS
jgi:hypothetical protein